MNDIPGRPSLISNPGAQFEFYFLMPWPQANTVSLLAGIEGKSLFAPD
jgi:hypothetical protein